MQDDLATIFDHGMRLSGPQLITEAPISGTRLPLGYSASQHYHHPVRPASPARLPEDPTEMTDGDSSSSSSSNSYQQDLIYNGIDPATLETSQLILFEHANHEQRGRLVELWRISTRISDARIEEEVQNSLGGSCAAEPYMEDAYGLNGLGSYDSNENARMLNTRPKETFSPLGTAVGGYRVSTDPVFQNASTEWWRHGDLRDQPIESQNGMYQQMRQYQELFQEDEMVL